MLERSDISIKWALEKYGDEWRWWMFPTADFVCKRKRKGAVAHSVFAYIDVVLNPDEVASPQVSRWQRRHIQLLVEPLVFFSRLDFASGEGGQLPGFCLHHFAPGEVLNRLQFTSERV